MNKDFVFDDFVRCHFNDDFLDKGSEAYFTKLMDDSILVTIFTSHDHRRLTKSYRNMDEFLKDFSYTLTRQENEK